MTCCVQRMLLANCDYLEVERQSRGTYDEDGRWDAGEIETVFVRAEIQPLTGEELVRETQGRRVHEAILLYALDPLYGVDPAKSNQPDVIKKDGLMYEVEKVENWEVFYRVIALRTEGNA